MKIRPVDIPGTLQRGTGWTIVDLESPEDVDAGENLIAAGLAQKIDDTTGQGRIVIALLCSNPINLTPPTPPLPEGLVPATR